MNNKPDMYLELLDRMTMIRVELMIPGTVFDMSPEARFGAIQLQLMAAFKELEKAYPKETNNGQDV